MSKFKPGDVVRNVSGSGGTIRCRNDRYGQIAYDYTDGSWDHEESLTLVQRAEAAYNFGDRVQLTGHGYDQDHGTIRQIIGNKFRADWDNGCGGDVWFFLDDISPSTKPKLGLAIVARVEVNGYRPNARPRIHATVLDAQCEAERLAIKEPGVSFAVFTLASTSTAVAPKPVQPTVTTVYRRDPTPI